MTDYVFPPFPATSVSVEGADARFPVRRVFCVGRNYAEHAREMGHDPDREPPFFFAKPADALTEEKTVPYPPLTKDLHHEIELVVAIGKDGTDIPFEQAASHIFGYAVGIDLTRRDLQGMAKKAGRPWEWGKAFDLSAPIGPIVKSEGKSLSKGRIWLAVNGTVRQESDLSELIWSVPEIIADCSRSVALKRGDLIFTGTPAGVAACLRGDRLTGGVEGVGEIDVTIA
jgi:fumarylpyruvate hydrolase